MEGHKGHMSQCPVCLTEYKEGERIRLLPNCEHIFHRTCINTWLESHPTCPLCRTDVQAPSQAPEKSVLSGADSVFDQEKWGQPGHRLLCPRSYSGGQRQTVVTPPPQQNRSNITAPPPPVTVNSRWSRPIGRELQELPVSDAPAPPITNTNTNTVEAGEIFSSVWGPYVGTRSPGPSSSSSSGFNQASVTIAGSEEGCSSAKDFVAISLDSD